MSCDWLSVKFASEWSGWLVVAHSIFQHTVSLVARPGHRVDHITLPFNKPVEGFVASRQVLKVVL